MPPIGFVHCLPPRNSSTPHLKSCAHAPAHRSYYSFCGTMINVYFTLLRFEVQTCWSLHVLPFLFLHVFFRLPPTVQTHQLALDSIMSSSKG